MTYRAGESLTQREIEMTQSTNANKVYLQRGSKLALLCTTAAGLVQLNNLTFKMQ